MSRKKRVWLVTGTRPGRSPRDRQRLRQSSELNRRVVYGEGVVKNLLRGRGTIVGAQGRTVVFDVADHNVGESPVRVGDTVRWRGASIGDGSLVRAEAVKRGVRAPAAKARHDRVGGLDRRGEDRVRSWRETVEQFARANGIPLRGRTGSTRLNAGRSRP